MSKGEDHNSVDIDPEVVLQEPNNKYFLDILAQYKASVKENKQNHDAFLSDTIVGPFLTLSLGSTSVDVVLQALEVIEILMENSQNHIRLQQLLHFLDALNDVTKNELLPSESRASVAKMYELVKNAKIPLGPQLNKFNSIGGDSHSKELPHAYRSLKRIKPPARVTNLSVPSVVIKDRRTLITNALVKVEGIISVTYNVNRQLCIIRAKPLVPPSVLGTAIANLGFDCSLITKNENNEEVLIPMKPDEKLLNNTSGFEKENAPDYFPEEDDEVSDNAVARVGFNDDKEAQGKGWWNSASKLIRKSLYW